MSETTWTAKQAGNTCDRWSGVGSPRADSRLQAGDEALCPSLCPKSLFKFQVKSNKIRENLQREKLIHMWAKWIIIGEI